MVSLCLVVLWSDAEYLGKCWVRAANLFRCEEGVEVDRCVKVTFYNVDGECV